MNPNFLQGNKDHQMRLVTHFSSIHIPKATHVTNFCMLWEAPDQREPTIEWLELAQIE